MIKYRESEELTFVRKDAVHPAPNPSSILSVRSKPPSPFKFCVQKASRVNWHTLFTNSADFSSLTRRTSRLPGLSLSCRQKLDSSNPNTSSNTNLCKEWSLNPRIAFEMSDHTAGNSALSGLRSPLLFRDSGQI